jgi:hypothetical protein
MTITVSIDATFAHHGAIYEPRKINPDPMPKYGINLIAVQILGDLTKSPLFDARIAEIKQWFDAQDQDDG